MFCIEKLVSVELSCGAGPSHVVLEPGLPLLLDCNLGASDTPFNVSWLKDGQPLLPEGNDYLQYLVNGSVLLMPTSRDGQSPHGVAGAYSCVTGSSLGALMSRTVNVLLASRYPWLLLRAMVKLVKIVKFAEDSEFSFGTLWENCDLCVCTFCRKFVDSLLFLTSKTILIKKYISHSVCHILDILKTEIRDKQRCRSRVSSQTDLMTHCSVLKKDSCEILLIYAKIYFLPEY